MKILNNENEVEQIYIQVKDILKIYQIYHKRPSFLNNIFFNNIIIEDKNEKDFIKLSKKEEIDYFNQFDWIVDYKTIKNLKSNQLKLLFEQYSNMMNELINKIKSFKQDNPERKKLQLEYDLLLYKIKDTHSIFGNSINENTLPLPLVVDSNKDKYIIKYYKQKYKMELCLDPNTVILSKEDSSTFNKSDLSKDIFSLCHSIMILKEKILDNFHFTTYDYNLSTDKKRIIIHFFTKNYYDYHDTNIKEKIKELKNDIF